MRWSRPARSPRRAALTGVDALTAARNGSPGSRAQAGNREIAERLFVTEKTVEGHLAAAYRKLGIGSRSQLAASALQTDPLEPLASGRMSVLDRFRLDGKVAVVTGASAGLGEAFAVGLAERRRQRRRRPPCRPPEGTARPGRGARRRCSR